MQSYGTELKSENAPGNRSVFLLSRRAHLLTTSSEQTPYPSLRPERGRAHSFRCSSSPHKALRLCVAPYGGGIPDGPCALRGGCGFCGSLRSMLRAIIDRTVGGCWAREHPPTVSEKLPPEAFALLWVCCVQTHFLFAKKKQKQERGDGERKWRPIIWKLR